MTQFTCAERPPIMNMFWFLLIILISSSLFPMPQIFKELVLSSSFHSQSYTPKDSQPPPSTPNSNHSFYEYGQALNVPMDL